MLKKFVSLFKQDMTVAIRNYFHLVIIFLALIMIIVINFVVPDQIKLTPQEVFFDNSEGKVLQKFLIEKGVDKSRFFDSKEALASEVRNNSNTLGIIMEGTIDNAKFTIIHQGTESEEILNVLDATIESTLDTIRGYTKYSEYQVEYLRPKAEPIPFNKNLLPVFISFEVVMLGFLLIAVMVFQEKEDGSIRAYRVSPSGTLEYILSKTAVNLVLSTVYGGLIVLFTMGTSVNYLILFTVIILVSFLMTLLGLSISVFFKSLQEFLFVGVGVMALLSFPMISYFTPSFAPGFITWLPSYPVMFGLREILFPTGKTSLVISLILMLAVEGAVLFAVSYWAVKRKLMKEGI